MSLLEKDDQKDLPEQIAEEMETSNASNEVTFRLPRVRNSSKQYPNKKIKRNKRFQIKIEEENRNEEIPSKPIWNLDRDYTEYTIFHEKIERCQNISQGVSTTTRIVNDEEERAITMGQTVNEKTTFSEIIKPLVNKEKCECAQNLEPKPANPKKCNNKKKKRYFSRRIDTIKVEEETDGSSSHSLISYKSLEDSENLLGMKENVVIRRKRTDGQTDSDTSERSNDKCCCINDKQSENKPKAHIKTPTRETEIDEKKSKANNPGRSCECGNAMNAATSYSKTFAQSDKNVEIKDKKGSLKKNVREERLHTLEKNNDLTKQTDNSRRIITDTHVTSQGDNTDCTSENYSTEPLKRCPANEKLDTLDGACWTNKNATTSFSSQDSDKGNEDNRNCSLINIVNRPTIPNSSSEHVIKSRKNKLKNKKTNTSIAQNQSGDIISKLYDKKVDIANPKPRTSVVENVPSKSSGKNYNKFKNKVDIANPKPRTSVVENVPSKSSGKNYNKFKNKVDIANSKPRTSVVENVPSKSSDKNYNKFKNKVDIANPKPRTSVVENVPSKSSGKNYNAVKSKYTHTSTSTKNNASIPNIFKLGNRHIFTPAKQKVCFVCIKLNEETSFCNSKSSSTSSAQSRVNKSSDIFSFPVKNIEIIGNKILPKRLEVTGTFDEQLNLEMISGTKSVNQEQNDFHQCAKYAETVDIQLKSGIREIENLKSESLQQLRNNDRNIQGSSESLNIKIKLFAEMFDKNSDDSEEISVVTKIKHGYNNSDIEKDTEFDEKLLPSSTRDENTNTEFNINLSSHENLLALINSESLCKGSSSSIEATESFGLLTKTNLTSDSTRSNDTNRNDILYTKAETDLTMAINQRILSSLPSMKLVCDESTNDSEEIQSCVAENKEREYRTCSTERIEDKNQANRNNKHVSVRNEEKETSERTESVSVETYFSESEIEYTCLNKCTQKSNSTTSSLDTKNKTQTFQAFSLTSISNLFESASSTEVILTKSKETCTSISDADVKEVKNIKTVGCGTSTNIGSSFSAEMFVDKTACLNEHTESGNKLPSTSLSIDKLQRIENIEYDLSKDSPDGLEDKQDSQIEKFDLPQNSQHSIDTKKISNTLSCQTSCPNSVTFIQTPKIVKESDEISKSTSGSLQTTVNFDENGEVEEHQPKSKVELQSYSTKSVRFNLEQPTRDLKRNNHKINVSRKENLQDDLLETISTDRNGHEENEIDVSKKRVTKKPFVCPFPETLEASIPVDIETGYFREGRPKKRVDMVLVVPADGDCNIEKIRIQFLMNILVAGLLVECEPGKMEEHKRLIFVKIHAPDEIVDRYGDFYKCKRFFMESRLRFIGTRPGILEQILPRSKCIYEKDWLRILRANYQPAGYSNLNRSEIVQKILMHTPFSDYQDDIGITSLLKKKIFVDAYALHDGPYFFVKNQDANKINARQLLFYEWARKKSWLKSQPLHLVNEYFGDRVAMYFAFYGFYNVALTFAAIVGIIFTLMEAFDTTDDPIIKETCESKNKWLCPLCRSFKVCPPTKLSDSCVRAKISNMLDNPFTYWFAFFISVWATILITLWKRYENYLCWFWEIDKEEVKNTPREEFQMGAKEIERSELTGILKPYASTKKKVMRIVIITLIFLLCFATAFLTVIFMILFKYFLTIVFRTKSKNYGQYFVYAIYGSINISLLFVLERAFTKLSYVLSERENHRTQYAYENAVVYRLYAFTIAMTFPTLLFFAFIKGSFYTWPSDRVNWNTLYGIGMLNCGPFGCMDEVWVLLTTMLIVKSIAMRIFFSLRRKVTDYNQGPQINSTIPHHEREYLLKPLNITFLIGIYRAMVTQFGFTTLFVAAFPLAPLCALIANIIDLRATARLMVTSCRRPLLPRAPGLGAWGSIILGIALISALTNGLTVAWTTKTLQRKTYLKDHGDMNGFLFWLMTEFNTHEYLLMSDSAVDWMKYEGDKPKTCFFTGQRQKVDTDKGTKWELMYTHWQCKNEEGKFLINYEHIVVILLIISHILIPPLPEDIRQALIIENRVKQYVRAKRTAEHNAKFEDKSATDSSKMRKIKDHSHRDSSLGAGDAL